MAGPKVPLLFKRFHCTDMAHSTCLLELAAPVRGKDTHSHLTMLLTIDHIPLMQDLMEEVLLIELTS